MTVQLRSKGGCWTCKLRKKKCTEDRPACSTCRSLSITCYGYGGKPQWMDDLQQRELILKQLRSRAKSASRRKAAGAQVHVANVSIAPKPAAVLRECHDDYQVSTNGILTSDEGVSTENGSSQVICSNNMGIVAERDPLMSNITPEESSLMMYFLDVVFPIQFPLYQPSDAEGGRGWLLSLLLQHRSCSSAALLISDYHRRMAVAAGINSEEPKIQYHGLINDHWTLFTRLQLLFYELYRDQSTFWLTHLRVLIITAEQVFNDYVQRSPEVQDNEAYEMERSSSNASPLRTIDQMPAFRFLACTALWLDIILATTAGTLPTLEAYHSHLAGSMYSSSIETVMGCRSIVMCQIARIAAMYVYTARAASLPGAHCTAAEKATEDIRQTLQRGLEQKVALSEVPEANSSFMSTAPEDQKLLTRVFGLSAIIYLYLVLHGYKNLDNVAIPAAEVVKIIRDQSPFHMSGLVWPLYIVGSTATKDNEQFFRDKFADLQRSSPALQHRRRILRALEEIWSRRRVEPGFNWADSLQVSSNILLV